MFIIGERKTRWWVFSDFVVDGSYIYFIFLFLLTRRNSDNILRNLFNFQ